MVNQYWEEDAYIGAVADGIAAHWEQHGRKHLLFSFHSIPKRYFLAGDPYHCFCQGTARRVAARLGLAEGEWSLGFQSRFGREEWLKPYVDLLLHDYAQAGPKRVTVVCPGFATDCLETLEEINMQNREAFLVARRRGLRLRALPELERAARGALRAGRAAPRAGLAGARGAGRHRGARASRASARWRSARRPDGTRARTIPRDQRPRPGRAGLAGVLRIARLRAGGDGRRPAARLCRGHRRAPVPRPARRRRRRADPDLGAPGPRDARTAPRRRSASTSRSRGWAPRSCTSSDFSTPPASALSLLEARTFSPPAAPRARSQLGYFEEFGIPTTDLERSAAFWDALGLVAFEPVREPFARVVVAGRDLNLGLYDLDLRTPVLTFSATDMPERIAALRDAGTAICRETPARHERTGARDADRTRGHLPAPHDWRGIGCTAVAIPCRV